MALRPFTRNMNDNSSEAGFEFTFMCDLCGDGYKTKFIESKTYKKGGLFKAAGRAVSAGAYLTGHHEVGWAASEGASIASEKFEGMSPAWHKEHEQAFDVAQKEAMGHFHRCPKCRKYVCDDDWNEEEGLCVDDAPREASEVAAARAEKMVEDIKAKAKTTQVYSGEITSRQTLCPKCGKPAGSGKFCNNCGAPISMQKCPKCGAKNISGTRFCGECGAKL